MERPRVSLLLPTRNRPELAACAVQAALACGGDDDELIVADNGDAPLDLPRDDARLRHLAPSPAVLSMPDNWERALDAARGDWVLLLADKHMLVRGAIDTLLGLAERAGQRVVTYVYGVLRQELSEEAARQPARLRSAGGAFTTLRDGGPLEVRSSEAALHDLYARQLYPNFYPMLYTALVRREVIEEARRRSPRFFVGPSPDIASCVQILAASPTYLATLVPAVLLQFPSAGTAWSNGALEKSGDFGARFRQFLDEFGASPLARHAAPPLAAGVILATLLDFLDARPDLAGQLQPSWSAFALNAAREIEGRPLASALALHGRVLRRTQRGRVRPAAAWVQLRAALGLKLPRMVVEPLLAVRRRVSPSDEPAALPERVTRRVASRAEALGVLRDAVARAGS